MIKPVATGSPNNTLAYNTAFGLGIWSVVVPLLTFCMIVTGFMGLIVLTMPGAWVAALVYLLLVGVPWVFHRRSRFITAGIAAGLLTIPLLAYPIAVLLAVSIR